MGAFFSNLQVKIPAQESLSHRDIIDCIIKIHKDEGYETTENEESADKSIIIASEESTSWYSIYDDDFEHNPKELTQLASVLSGMLNTDVMSTMVGDSDYLKISLYNKTKETCNINNFNDNFSFTFSELNNWLQILAEGETIENISNIFKENEIFVEKYLDHLAPLFEISPLYWELGYKYFEEIMPNNGTKLHFTKKEKEKEEETTHACPTLRFLSYQSEYNVKMGTPYLREFTVGNTGVSTTGISIILVGEAIEHGIINIDKLRARIAHSEDSYETSFYKTISTDNRKLLVADFEDLYIDKGTFLPPKHSTKNLKNYIENIYKSAIFFEFELEGLKATSTSFSIFAIPLPQDCGQSACVESTFTIE